MSKYLGFEPEFNLQSYFFVSYDGSDTVRVAPIVSDLHSKGIGLWYDYGLEYGENWSGQLAERISQCKAVILFLSRETLRRDESFVYKEYIMAKEFYGKKIYVVILDNIENKDVTSHWLPWWIELKQKQCIQAWRFDSAEKISSLIQMAVSPSHEIVPTPYFILEDLQKQNGRLERTPAGYRYVRLLVFVIVDGAGKRFIPFQYPRYGSIWTTPHIDFSLMPASDKRFTDISKILFQYDYWMKKYNDVFDILETHQLYQMGMFNAESKRYVAYTEYKISPTLQDRYQCYRIDEHHITYLDPDELINIYDPEKLHGYKYFPLDQDGFAEESSHYVRCSGEDVFFFGKKLSTNIVRLFGDNKRFSDCTYKLPDDVYLDENGYISGK